MELALLSGPQDIRNIRRLRCLSLFVPGSHVSLFFFALAHNATLHAVREILKGRECGRLCVIRAFGHQSFLLTQYRR